jgi:hypothetical protein
MMTTYRFTALLRTIIAMREKYATLYKVTTGCSEAFELGGDDLRRAIFKGRGVKKPGEANEGLATVNFLKGVIFDNGVGEIFRQLHQCQEELDDLASVVIMTPAGNNIREAFAKQLSIFEEHLQTFLQTPDVTPALRLARSGAAIRNDYFLTYNNASAALEALEPGDAAPPGMKELTIFVPSEQTYRGVVEKLAAIADLYDEVCNLAGVSAAEFPLRISKIESGSLWLKLFGESKVIALLTRLIENGANFTYRNFTQEGKLREIPKNIETIRAELKLLEELEQAGISTAEMRENIEKSSVIISDRINTLLSGSSEITVNERSFGVKQELERMIQEHSKVRLIEDGSQHQEAGGEEMGRAQLPPTNTEPGS